MVKALRGIVVMARIDIRTRAAAFHLVIGGLAAGILTVAGAEARHTVLASLAALGFLAAGAGCLLRYRVTGTATTRDLGCGLALLGLHRPAAVGTSALLEGRLPEIPGAIGLLFVLAAATACL